MQAQRKCMRLGTGHARGRCNSRPRSQMKDFRRRVKSNLKRAPPTCETQSLRAFAGYLHAGRVLRQLIAAIIVGVRGMALGPLPFHFVLRYLLVQLMPEILIRDRFLAAGLPAVPFPLMNPLGDPMLDIVGVGHDLYFTRFLQCPQPFDGGFELHSIVSGLLFAAEDLALLAAIPEDAGPTAWAGIADTRAVGDELDLFEFSLQQAIRRGFRRVPAGKKHLPDPQFVRPQWPCKFRRAASIHCERRG